MIVDQKIKKKFIGVYLIDGNVDGIQLATTTEPSWLKKKLTKLILGWEWVNIIKLNSNK